MLDRFLILQRVFSREFSLVFAGITHDVGVNVLHVCARFRVRIDHFLKEYHFEVTDKQQMIRVLVNGVLSDSPVDVVAVIKEIATLLDTYAASVQ